jgi:hypothetical protein
MRHGAIRENAREVPRFYGGVEAWPGLLFKEADTGCLFMDKLRQLPYSEPFWRNEANRAFDVWKGKVRHVPPPPDLLHPVAFDGHAWPRLEQIPEEFSWWLKQLLDSGATRLLTIGSMCGGAEWHTARAFHEQGRRISITAVDINARKELLDTFAHARAQFGQELALVSGDSRSEDVRRRLADTYDAVFIDGDHGYRGARADFDLAKSRRAKLVGLHDIVDSDWHADARCCVSRLWREIKQEARTEERAAGNWGGIGVVRLSDH